MPYKVVKSGSGYKVAGPEGTKYSKHPQSRAKAAAQMRAMYASEFRGTIYRKRDS